MCDALHYLLDNIFIRFGSKLYRQIVGIPMGTNCAPLVADLFLFCYEGDFILSLSDNTQTDLNLSITNGIVSSKIYDKQDAFNFEKANFFLPMVFIFLSLFVLLECVLMLM